MANQTRAQAQNQSTQSPETIQISRELYYQISSALLELGHFALNAEAIAGNLEIICAGKLSLPAVRNIRMLQRLAVQAGEIDGEGLSAQICDVADKQGC